MERPTRTLGHSGSRQIGVMVYADEGAFRYTHFFGAEVGPEPDLIIAELKKHVAELPEAEIIDAVNDAWARRDEPIDPEVVRMVEIIAGA